MSESDALDELAAAGKLMSEQLDQKKSGTLVDAAIKELPQKLH